MEYGKEHTLEPGTSLRGVVSGDRYVVSKVYEEGSVTFKKGGSEFTYSEQHVIEALQAPTLKPIEDSEKNYLTGTENLQE